MNDYRDHAEAIGDSTGIGDPVTTTDTIHAFPAAQKITAGDLRVGDRLFDTTGGTHEIVRVSYRRGWVDTRRDDGWPDRFHHTDILTIIRP